LVAFSKVVLLTLSLYLLAPGYVKSMLSLIERVLALRPSFICERRYRRSLAVYPPTMDEQSLNAGVLDLATHKTCGTPCYRGARWALTPPFHPYRCIPKQPDSGKTRARRAGGRYRPHTVRGLGLDQKDLGPPRAAPGSGSSVRHTSRAAPRGGRVMCRPREVGVCHLSKPTVACRL
jgi:hypothetical protein